MKALEKHGISTAGHVGVVLWTTVILFLPNYRSPLCSMWLLIRGPLLLTNCLHSAVSGQSTCGQQTRVFNHAVMQDCRASWIDRESLQGHRRAEGVLVYVSVSGQWYVDWRLLLIIRIFWNSKMDTVWVSGPAGIQGIRTSRRRGEWWKT